MQVAVSDLRNREDGQTTTEYAILLGFLAIAIIAAIVLLKDEIIELFEEAASSVDNAPNP
jgi:pilus assembly protein Flp/PilA